MALEKAGKAIDSVFPSPKLQAVLASLHGGVLYAIGQFIEACEVFERAVGLYEAIPDPFEACRAAVNLGQALIAAKRPDEARERLGVAVRLAEKGGYDRPHAFALSHLGYLEYQAGRPESAEAQLLRSNGIARPREYLTVVFRNCYYLRRVALERGDKGSARANERTLRVYSGRVDADLPEAVSFRDEMAGGPDAQA